MDNLESRAEHHYADSNGVKIHYATLGEASKPLIVFVHGFPDFWFSWRHQMEALSKDYYTAALDLRGYNLSDKPKGVENYDMRLLVADVVSVIKDCKREKAIVAGHDWGGAISWQLAMHVPQVVDRLIIVNLPHPRGLSRELANNPEQQKNSGYARNFQLPDAHAKLTAEGLARIAPEEVREKYVEAFQRSDFESMLNYYKRNYPRPPYQESTSQVVKVQCPVLMFHGLKDWALLPGALNNTWEWLDKDFTLVTIPRAGHWSHWDAKDLLSRTIANWLK
jgi:pimeloyl-ACP methyl ester carboxylesterase